MIIMLMIIVMIMSSSSRTADELEDRKAQLPRQTVRKVWRHAEEVEDVSTRGGFRVCACARFRNEL